MLAVDRHQTAHRLGGAVHPEWLRVIHRVRLCQDDAPGGDFLIVDAGNRIGHLQLKGPVSLLYDHAGGGIGEDAQAVGAKGGLLGGV